MAAVVGASGLDNSAAAGTVVAGVAAPAWFDECEVTSSTEKWFRSSALSAMH